MTMMMGAKAVTVVLCLCGTMLERAGAFQFHNMMIPASSIATKRHYHPSSTSLFMGKGLNKNRSKQAELAKKMALAKQQKEGGNGDSSSAEDAKAALSAKEIKEKNDRLRFDELLKTKSISLNDMNDGYLTAEQEQEEIAATTSRRAIVDRLFEGDPAPTDPFGDLVDVERDVALGDRGARNLLAKHKYTIVVCDPRPKSYELRTALDNIAGTLPHDLRSKLIVINADSPAENRRHWKKKGLKLKVYSDENKDWMRSYTALGDKRWSIGMYIIANEKIQKLARDVDSISASRTIRNAVKSLDLP